MYELFISYLFFLLKGLTVVLLITAVIAVLASLRNNKVESAIRFESLNQKRQDLKKALLQQFAKSGVKASKQAYKQYLNTIRTKKKLDSGIEKLSKRGYVLHFVGDTKASAVKALREEITAILHVAQADDEVVVVLESPGGSVPDYGLVAAQLIRIKQAKLRLTVCVDKVAASGGYLAAVVADRVLAAPFAYIGSIGVVLTMPNIHELLKKNNVDVIELTAGKYKRSVTAWGKTTEVGKRHTKEKMQSIHDQFKDLVVSYRPQIDINTVASGEYWTAKNAMSLGLIDDITTSDTYISELTTTCEVYTLSTPKKRNLKQMLVASTQAMTQTIIDQLQSSTMV